MIEYVGIDHWRLHVFCVPVTPESCECRSRPNKWVANECLLFHMRNNTTAIHLLRAGVDVNTIRAWLGHVSIDTTKARATLDSNRAGCCRMDFFMTAQLYKTAKEMLPSGGFAASEERIGRCSEVVLQ